MDVNFRDYVRPDIRRIALPSNSKNISKCSIDSEVLDIMIQASAFSQARFRGGMLFGHHFEDAAMVLFASTYGRASWYGNSLGMFREIDPRYALGFSDAMQALSGDNISWIGNWIAPLSGHYKDEQVFEDITDQYMKENMLTPNSLLVILNHEVVGLKLSASFTIVTNIDNKAQSVKMIKMQPNYRKTIVSESLKSDPEAKTMAKKFLDIHERQS